MDNQKKNRELLKSKLLEEGVSSYRKRGRKRTAKKKVNLRKDFAKEVEELWSERVSHSEIKYINKVLIWLWESLPRLWSNPRINPVAKTILPKQSEAFAPVLFK